MSTSSSVASFLPVQVYHLSAGRMPFSRQLPHPSCTSLPLLFFLSFANYLAVCSFSPASSCRPCWFPFRWKHSTALDCTLCAHSSPLQPPFGRSVNEQLISSTFVWPNSHSCFPLVSHHANPNRPIQRTSPSPFLLDWIQFCCVAYASTDGAIVGASTAATFLEDQWKPSPKWPSRPPTRFTVGR